METASGLDRIASALTHAKTTRVIVNIISKYRPQNRTYSTGHTLKQSRCPSTVILLRLGTNPFRDVMIFGIRKPKQAIARRHAQLTVITCVRHRGGLQVGDEQSSWIASSRPVGGVSTVTNQRKYSVGQYASCTTKSI